MCPSVCSEDLIQHTDLSPPPVLVVLDDIGDDAVFDKVELICPLGFVVVECFDFGRGAEIVWVEVDGGDVRSLLCSRR